MLTSLLHSMHAGHWTAVGLGFLLILLVSFVPVIPIPLIAGVLGSVLPLWIAVCVAWLATVAGAVLKFGLERTVLRGYVHELLSHYKHWDTVLRLVDRHGFLAIVGTRLIPFFPSAIVNFAAAMTRLPFPSYLLATAIGLFPSIFTFTLAGNQIGSHSTVTITLILVYGTVVAILLWKVRSLFKAHENETKW